MGFLSLQLYLHRVDLLSCLAERETERSQVMAQEPQTLIIFFVFVVFQIYKSTISVNFLEEEMFPDLL